MLPGTFQSSREKESATRAIRAHIGRQLQATYQSDLIKPLSARLAELLRRLADCNNKTKSR